MAPDVTSTSAVDAVNTIRDLFQQQPYLSLRGIGVEWCDGALILRGRVDSYYLKQFAQSAAARMSGVGPIVNLLDVIPGR